eukprot:1134957-Pleurochrysis_carterae.AAC.1
MHQHGVKRMCLASVIVKAAVRLPINGVAKLPKFCSPDKRRKKRCATEVDAGLQTRRYETETQQAAGNE